MKNSLIFGILLLLASCGTPIKKEDILGCWTVMYIDANGIKTSAKNYQMCFNENDELITQKEDGSEQVKAEYNLEEKDSLIVIYYPKREFPDTMKIIKAETKELHLRLRQGKSIITFYLRK